MPVTNGIVSVPITEPSQLQSIFGYTGITQYDKIFTDMPIKMWAKYKPFRSSVTGIPTENERKRNGYGVTATKYDVNSSSVRTTMLNNAIAGNTGWVYEKPRGLAYNEWFRGHDWVGYNHNSICPFYLENATITGQLKIRVGQVVSLPTNNMAVTDIAEIIGMDDPSMSGYGFIIRKGSNVIHIDAINDKNQCVYPLNTDHEVTLSTETGTYDVCCYITDINRGNTVIHPLGGFTTTVSAPADPVRINAYFDSLSISKPTFYFTIWGNQGNTVPADTATLILYNSSGTEFFRQNFNIPALEYNASYSYDEKFEIGQTIYSWQFSYQGVPVTG